MKDQSKTKQMLIQELVSLRQRIAELEQSLSNHKRLEEVLIEEKERLDLALDGTGYGIWDWNSQSGEIIIDEHWQRVLGYQPHERIFDFNWWRESVHPESMPVFEKAYSDYCNDLAPYYELEYRIRHKSGEWRWVWARGKCVARDTEGKPARFIGTHIDITKRKKMESELLENKEFTENLIASMQEGFSVLDSRGVHIYVNPALCRMTGFSKEELIGVGPPHPYWPPETIPEIERFFQKTLQSEFSEFELTFMRKNGERFPIIVSPSEVKDKQGNVISYFATVKDITERKQAEAALRDSEERFRTLYENAPVLIDGFDNNGRCILWNKECEKVFGWTINEINSHDEPLALFYPDPNVRKQVVDTVIYKPEKIFREWHPLTRDGKELTALWANFQLPSGMIINIGLDITERKQAEEALRESQEKLTLAMRAASMGSWLINLNTGQFEADAPAMMLHGFEAGETVTTLDQRSRHVYPADIPEIQRRLEQAIKTKGTYENEYRVVLPDGNIRWIYSLGRVPKDTPYLIGMVMDITERKEAETALRRQAVIMDQTYDAIFAWELDAGIVFWNRGAEQLYGFPSAEAMAHFSHQLLHTVFPESRQQVLDELRRAGWWEGELRHQTRDGRSVLVESRMSLAQTAGELLVVEANRDITERKRMEDVMQARLRLVECSATHSSEEVLVAALDEVEALTGSQIGFYHFLEADQRTLSLQAWSTRTVRELCTAEGKGHHYDLDEAGVWVDCVRERRPVIHNDYATLPHKKGLPPGHAPVNRELVVPIFRQSKIVALLGVGNKPRDYSTADVELVAQFADLAWDIAERKQAEEALWLSKERVSKILHSIPDALVVSRLEDGKIIEINDNWQKVFGYDRDEAIGNTSLVLNLFVDPADRQRIIDLLREQGFVRDFELQFRKKSGMVRTAELSIELQEIQSEQYMLTVVQDITVRKQAEEALQKSEERFRELVETINDIFYELDEQGIIQYVSPSVELLLGYNQAETIGRSITDFLVPEDTVSAIKNVQNVIDGHLAANEYRIRRKSGEIGWIRVSSSPVMKGDRIVGIRGVLSDITERKLAEEKINASLREKDILISEIHHRVKNNMQVISGLLDLQAKASKNPEVIEAIRESRSRVQAMAMVHEKLYNTKDFSKIDLAGYVRSLSQELLQSHNIHPEKTDLIIQTDGEVYVDIIKAIPCGLIINELISNALKHAFPGDKPGKLHIIIRETENKEIEIIVRDNGVGLPVNVDICEPRSVGLHLVNGLAKHQLDGQMEIKRDNGTEFRITFPL